MKQQDRLASAQMISFHPILKESVEMRTQYFLYLKRLVALKKDEKETYTTAQLSFYKNNLCGNSDDFFSSRYCYLLPYDLALILGFEKKLVKASRIKCIIDKIVADFQLPYQQSPLLYLAFESALGNPVFWDEILESDLTIAFTDYLKLVRKNAEFIYTKPYHIFITATMSAGKSTLINALVGKDISRMQNMACTSKIHTIVAKHLEDGVISEDDHELSLNASREELLTDHEKNNSDDITVGTYFNSNLGGKRIILYDSPGVNSSENKEHTEITQRMITSKNYQLMLYTLNATQLATVDEKQHLQNVRQHLGRTKIIFVLNKADQLLTDEDHFLESIDNQRRFLVENGFKNPVICPVSSKAAYLVKKSKNAALSRLEQRELENYMDKFEQQSLSEYYEKKLKCSPIQFDNEIDGLFVRCGFAYLEHIIANRYEGGNKNGASIR